MVNGCAELERLAHSPTESRSVYHSSTWAGGESAVWVSRGEVQSNFFGGEMSYEQLQSGLRSNFSRNIFVAFFCGVFSTPMLATRASESGSKL